MSSRRSTPISLWRWRLLDFEVLSIEEVTGKLKAVDDREEALPTKPVAIGSKLVYTE